MNEMIDNFTNEAIKEGIKTIDMPTEAAREVVKNSLDGKSVVIGGVGGAILTATGIAVGRRLKNKPKEITEEIKNDPRVREATIQKLLKKKEAGEKNLNEIYSKLDQLGYVEEDVIIEEETPEE